MSRAPHSDACKQAGFKVKRAITEPAAILLAYGIQQAHRDTEGLRHNIVVVDMGGSSTKVSVAVSQGGVYRIVAHTSTNEVCGKKYDDVLVQILQGEFKRWVAPGRAQMGGRTSNIFKQAQ
jgi:molecular chaperone DnaK (HSP70)